MILPGTMASDLAKLASQEAPKEAIALIGFDRFREEPRLMAPIANRSSTPEQTFFVVPHEQYKVEMGFRKLGCYLGAIFHTHPTREPIPSEADKEFCPSGVIMIIAGRDDRVEGGWKIRAWLRSGTEIPVQVPVQSDAA